MHHEPAGNESNPHDMSPVASKALAEIHEEEDNHRAWEEVEVAEMARAIEEAQRPRTRRPTE